MFYVGIRKYYHSKEKSSVFTKFFKGFGLLLTYEIIEELLEEAIAWTITTVLARALSFLLVVVLTQCTKVTIKYSVKLLKVLLKPLVTKLVYRPGNDKVNFIRKLFCKIFRIESNDNSNELIEVKNDEQNSSENNKQEAVIMADNEVKVSKFKQFVARVVEFVKCNKNPSYRQQLLSQLLLVAVVRFRCGVLQLIYPTYTLGLLQL